MSSDIHDRKTRPPGEQRSIAAASTVGEPWMLLMLLVAIPLALQAARPAPPWCSWTTSARRRWAICPS